MNNLALAAAAVALASIAAGATAAEKTERVVSNSNFLENLRKK